MEMKTNMNSAFEASEWSALVESLQLARTSKTPAHLIAAIPYAGLLGIQGVYENEELLFHLPAKSSNIGNPTLPALHGGATGGFMEMACTLHLLMTMETVGLPKVVDFSIDFIRAGRFVDTYASCQVVRQGRKLANVMVQAWQQDRQEPIATARAHFVVE
jgi:acyl-coenzyme A thioesterase PaaI-like protein